VILNDDNVNTFDHVITCLMDICAHNYHQAMQCATITHNVGKCSVYIDNHDSCVEVSKQLTFEKLKTEVIKYKNNV